MEKTVALYTAVDNHPSLCFVLLLETALKGPRVFHVFDHDVSWLQWCVCGRGFVR